VRETPSIPVVGQKGRFPVHRIYCVGRNYAAHAREMGKDPEKEPPFFFLKPADAIVPEGGDVHYPPGTSNLHHEIELVVAIHRGGFQIPSARALDHVYGYGVGLDMTRRDLQFKARDMGRPWDFGKAFDESAPITAIYPVASHGHHSANATLGSTARCRRAISGHDLERCRFHRLCQLHSCSPRLVFWNTRRQAGYCATSWWARWMGWRS
jgi:2-keto-4-pentenoate hydratase/2-oxohepta-3-ene-1,7-dioic acid hydratase in catechol pathway